MASRSVVYVDGFNLYYGALRGGPNKWLDLQQYFTRLRPHDEIVEIRYFPARIVGPSAPNQDAYLRALETLPLVTVYLGKFKTKRVLCRVTGCSFAGDRRFPAPEEKRTDVSIAIHMLDDAYQDRCDRLIVVSGDSDLVPAVHMVKTRFPEKEVFVYVPSRNPVRGAAVELRGAADKNRSLPLDLLRRSQLPPNVPDGMGGVVSKPPTW